MRTENELTDNILRKAANNIKNRQRRLRMWTSVISIVLCVGIIGGIIGIAPLLNRLNSVDSTENPGGITASPGDSTGNPPEDSTRPVIRDPDYVGPSGELSDGGQLPSELYNLSITADKKVKGLVACDSGFTLKTVADTTAETLYDYLNVYPECDMEIVKTDTSTFALKLGTGVMNSGELYRLCLGDTDNPDYSYAFQTESKFVVSSYLPANNKADIPVNTSVEVSFSESITSSEFSSHFRISPEVQGEFVIYPDGRTVAFVPTNPLEEACEYTVTVQKGLQSVNGHALEEDYSFRFSTYSRSGESDFRIESVVYVISGESIGIRVDMDSEIQEENNESIIYRYRSYEDAINAIKEYEKNKTLYSCGLKQFNTDDLLTVSTCKTQYELNSNDDSSFHDFYARYKALYPALEAGVYLIEIKYAPDRSVYVHVIVSDYCLYTESRCGDALTWVTDRNGNCVAGAAVSGELFNRSTMFWGVDTDYTAFSGTTNADGVFTFKTNGKNGAVFTVTKDGKSALAAVALKNTSVPEYSAYVYTDREVYFSNDKVNIFGIIKNGSDSLPSQLVLITQTGDKYDVSVDEYGYFTARFDIVDYAAFSVKYYLYTTDGVSVYSGYAPVTQETKPMYKGTLTYDRLYYRYGDTATMTLSVTFFDGTPAPGLVFNIQAGYSGSDPTVTTGSDGTCTVEVKLDRLYTETTAPKVIYSTARLTGVETTYLTVESDGAAYFCYDAYLSVKYDTTGSTPRRIVSLRKLNPEKITSKNDLTDDRWSSLYRMKLIALCDDGPVNGEVNVILESRNRVYVSGETVYDPITKTTYTTDHYDIQLITEKSYTGTVVNGELELPFYNGTDVKFYQYKIIYSGVSVYASALRVNGNSRYYTDDTCSMLLNAEKYGIGDTVSAQMLYDSKSSGGKTLYTLYNGGLVSYTIGDGISFEFKKEYAAGAVIFATAKYDGKFHYSYCTVDFDYTKYANLEFEILSDASSYAPGETVSVTLRAKLPDGTPAAGARAVLSVVDEACFALANQQIDILTSYYGKVYDTSAGRNDLFGFRGFDPYPDYYDEGGMGDDGPSYPSESPDHSDKLAKQDEETKIRKIFADNPVFAVLTADSAGVMTYSFTVPDNITEWRLTAVGYCNSTEIRTLGSTVSDIICTLPYFINAGICDYYLTGDDLCFTARSYGTATAMGAGVSYRAELYTEAGKLVKTIENVMNVGEYAVFNFGRQLIGNYYVIVTGKCGDHSDGVRLSTQVCATGAAIPVNRVITPDELSAIEPVRYPVTLVFTNTSYAAAVSTASRFMYATYGRADYLAAAYAANELMYKMYGGETYRLTMDKIADEFNSGSGLLTLLSYSSGDIILTAKVCAVAAGAFDEARKANIVAAVREYLHTTGDYDSVNVCAAYLTLASLGEPVLGDLYALQNNSSNLLSPEAKIYLSAAYAAIGDYSSALTVSNGLKNEYYVTDANGTYFNADATIEKIRLTALSLIMFSRIDRESAQGCLDFINEYSSAYESYCIEKAFMLRFFKAEPAEKGTLSYTYSDGEKAVEVEIDGFSDYRLTLSSEAFSHFKILNAEGIGIYASYLGSCEAALGDSAQTDDLKLTKKIELYDKQQQIYKVTIDYTINTYKNRLSFSLSDTIPAGAMYTSVKKPGQYQVGTNCYSLGCLTRISGRNMTGYINVFADSDIINGVKQYDPGPYSASGSIVYYIRVAAPGNYMVEPAVAINGIDGTYQISNDLGIYF